MTVLYSLFSSLTRFTELSVEIIIIGGVDASGGLDLDLDLDLGV